MLYFWISQENWIFLLFSICQSSGLYMDEANNVALGDLPSWIKDFPKTPLKVVDKKRKTKNKFCSLVAKLGQWDSRLKSTSSDNDNAIVPKACPQKKRQQTRI